MDTGRIGLEIESSYQVISYPGPTLPEQYQNLVFSKWLRSNRFGNDYMKLIDSNAYFNAYHNYIESILKRHECVVRLAVLADDKDVVLGFSVSEPSVLHYCHVHKDQRKQGIATSLLPKDIEIFTHLTKTAMSIWNSKYPNWILNPFI